MFARLKQAAADAGNAVSNAAAEAKKKMEGANANYMAQCFKEDAVWFQEMLNLPYPMQPMDAMTFQQLVANYKGADVPNERQRVIQDACRSGAAFTCQQVIEIVKSGDVPLETVGAATWMYMRTVDRQNWHLVYSAYDVPLSKDSLKQRIEKAPQQQQPQVQAAVAAPTMQASVPGVNINMNMTGGADMNSMNATSSMNSMNAQAQPAQMNVNMGMPAVSVTMSGTPDMGMGMGMQLNENSDKALLWAEILRLRTELAACQASQGMAQATAQMGNMQVGVPGVNVQLSGAAAPGDMNAMGGNSNMSMQVNSNVGGMGGMGMGGDMGMGMGGDTGMGGMNTQSSSMTAPIDGGSMTVNHSVSSGSGPNGASSFSETHGVSTEQSGVGTFNIGGMQMEGNVTTTTSSTTTHSESNSGIQWG